MTKGTRNLVRRLKQLIHEASEGSRAWKEREKTPYNQQQPLPPLPPGQKYYNFGTTIPDYALRAHVLCSVRAAMRSRLHSAKWGDKQLEKIEELFVAAAKWEQWPVGQQPPLPAWSHATFPKWLRETVKAALATCAVEQERHVKRNERYARYLLTAQRATG